MSNSPNLVALGSVKVIVPPGVKVEVACTPILGSVQVDDELAGYRSSGGPTLLLRGLANLGNIEVRQQLPGESRGAAKKQQRQRKKELLEAARTPQITDGRSGPAEH